MNIEEWESREDLLELVRGRGYPVTESQLARWHRAGLIPRPEQRSLGRGRGTQTVYPPSTRKQLLRLCEIHFGDGVKRLPHVGWQLWWEDHGVSFDLIRSFLDRIAISVDKELKNLLDLGTKAISDEKWEELVEGSRTARLDKPVRGMRRRVGRDRMPTLMSIMIAVHTGLYEAFQIGAIEGLEDDEGNPQDDSDAQIVVEGFGFDRGSKVGQPTEASRVVGDELEITLGEGGKLFREHSLSEVVDAATEQELLRSRDHIRLILQATQQLGVFAKELPRSEAAAFLDLSREMSDTGPTEQALLVLAWTMWSLWGPPDTREIQDAHHEELQQAMDTIQELGLIMVNTME